MFKKSVVVAILTSILFSFNAFAAVLPDYEKEAESLGAVSCDEASTSAKQYWAADRYIVIVANTKDGTVFYYLQNTEGEFFFSKRGGALTEMQHDPWDDDLLKNAPNIFMALHGMPSDCLEKNK